MPSLIAILGLDRSGFSSGLDQAKGESQSKGMDIGAILGKKMVAGLATAAIVAAAKKEFDAIGELATKAKEIKFGASRLDVGTTRFQDLEYAAAKGRTSIEAIYGAYRKLAVGAQDALGGNKELVDHFAQLGVSVGDLKNKSPDELFRQISAQMDGASMNGAKLAAVIKTMGKSADELLPAMRAGIFGGHDPFAIPQEDLQALQQWKSDWGVIGGVWNKMKEELHMAHVWNLGMPVNAAANWLRGQFAMDSGHEAKPAGLTEAAEAEVASAREAADVKKELLREEEHQRQRLIGLVEKQMDLNKRFVTGGMNDTQKLAQLEARRNTLLQQTFDLTTAQGAADAQERNNKLTETNIEMQQMLKAEEGGLRKTRPDVNAMQRIGAYAGPPDRNYTLIAAIEQHVKTISGKISTNKSTTSGGF